MILVSPPRVSTLCLDFLSIRKEVILGTICVKPERVILPFSIMKILLPTSSPWILVLVDNFTCV